MYDQVNFQKKKKKSSSLTWWLRFYGLCGRRETIVLLRMSTYTLLIFGKTFALTPAVGLTKMDSSKTMALVLLPLILMHFVTPNFSVVFGLISSPLMDCQMLFSPSDSLYINYEQEMMRVLRMFPPSGDVQVHLLIQLYLFFKKKNHYFINLPF